MYIDYSKILKKNLKNVLHEVLLIIEKKGLKEGHHLYITFDKNHKYLKIPNWLKNKYKHNITIVIQYEFWNLNVQKNEFSIDLSFNNTIANLTVPFNSIISFADPYANFGLQIAKDNSIKKVKKEKSKIQKNKIINLDQYRKN